MFYLFNITKRSPPKGMNNNNYSAKYEVGNYKGIHSLVARSKKSKRLRKLYPDRIPIIVEYSTSFPVEYQTLEKQKYLVPSDFELSVFIQIIRKHMKLNKKHSLCIWINNTMPKITTDIGTLYTNHKDDDGFLYIKLEAESTFGNNLRL